MTRDDRRLLLALAAAGTVWMAAAATVGQIQGALFLGPLLLLLLPLLGGRFAGERAITRMRARFVARGRAARRPRSAPGAIPRRVLRTRVPRGTSLLATHLAVRPPPAAASA